MAIELVTAYKGKDHVTAEQWADFNRGIYGDAAILPVGNKMETAIQTANQITVKDGVAVIDGRQVYIGYGESENIAIQSGTQGKLRRDIVVLEYKKEEVSGVETVQFKVITGTPADSDAKDPSVQDMDIRTGVFTSQKPFCRVRLNGTAIEGVDALVQVKEIKSHAFADPVRNLTTTAPGKALDAVMGKQINDDLSALSGKIGTAKTWAPLLLTAKGREVNQDKANGYAYGTYKIIGGIVFFSLWVKTKIAEDSEYARVSLPVKPEGMSEYQSVTVSNCSGLTAEKSSMAFISTNEQHILLQGDGSGGNNNVMWKNTGEAGYLKISGFYNVG